MIPINELISKHYLENLTKYIFFYGCLTDPNYKRKFFIENFFLEEFHSYIQVIRLTSSADSRLRVYFHL